MTVGARDAPSILPPSSVMATPGGQQLGWLKGVYDNALAQQYVEHKNNMQKKKKGQLLLLRRRENHIDFLSGPRELEERSRVFGHQLPF